jgi:hypothetical protein
LKRIWTWRLIWTFVLGWSIGAIEVAEIGNQFVAQRKFAGRLNPSGVGEAAGLRFQCKGFRPRESPGPALGQRFQQPYGAKHLGYAFKPVTLALAIDNINLRLRLAGRAQMRL